MRHRFLGALLAVAALATVAPPPVTAVEPSGYEYFHTYAEAMAAIDQTVADHPQLAQKFSIGKSYRGRPIFGLMLTANVGAGGQGRPEVVVDSLIHARERATVELALYIVDALTDNYGNSATALGRRATRILNSMVVYVLPVLNPDGAVYDMKGGVFHHWRKN